MKKATNIGRENLTCLGTCFGKFTKSGKFKLQITALDFLAPYAKVVFLVIFIIYCSKRLFQFISETDYVSPLKKMLFFKLQEQNCKVVCKKQNCNVHLSASEILKYLAVFFAYDVVELCMELKI